MTIKRISYVTATKPTTKTKMKNNQKSKDLQLTKKCEKRTKIISNKVNLY